MTAADLDQSGQSYQQVRAYLGPSLGWVMVRVKPETLIASAGTYTVQPGDSILLVNVAGLVTVQLPDVARWVKETAYNPATGFERAIYVKDYGGNAAAFNITIAPFGTNTIDKFASNFTIIQNRQLLRLYALNDLTGWWSG